MCDPVSIGLAAVGAASSLYGTVQQTSIANQQAKNVQAQNIADMTAQNTAFQARNQAGLQQTAAQFNAQQATMDARNQAFSQMRGQQTSALQQYQDTLKAQNEQADALRQTGDTAAQQLIQDTSGPQLAAAQTAQAAQAAQLLQSNQQPGGPQPTDPSGAVSNDAVTQGALARRTAEAATNIRNYGAKVGQLASYDAPAQQTALAIAANKYGIMPAQAAESLLQSGSKIQLLPSQVNYQAATGLGTAQDQLIQAKGQSALDTAGLTYGNAVDIANLNQSNAQTLAANQEKQTEANLNAQAAQAKAIGNLGNLALYGAGYTSGIDPSAAIGKVKTGISSLFS